MSEHDVRANPSPTSPSPSAADASQTRPRRTGVLVAGLAVVAAVLGVIVGAVVFGGDDDGRAAGDRPESSPSEDGEAATPVPGADGSTPEGSPDLDQELATSVSGDGVLELVVHDVRQDDEQVTVWATLTNVDDEEEYTLVAGRLADAALGVIDSAGRTDVSGMYLVDWAAGRAHYPVAINDETCLCSSAMPTGIEPGESVTVFAVYNGVGELEDGSLVMPGFLPADGLTGS